MSSRFGNFVRNIISNGQAGSGSEESTTDSNQNGPISAMDNKPRSTHNDSDSHVRAFSATSGLEGSHGKQHQSVNSATGEHGVVDFLSETNAIVADYLETSSRSAASLSAGATGSSLPNGSSVLEREYVTATNNSNNFNTTSNESHQQTQSGSLISNLRSALRPQVQNKGNNTQIESTPVTSSEGASDNVQQLESAAESFSSSASSLDAIERKISVIDADGNVVLEDSIHGGSSSSGHQHSNVILKTSSADDLMDSSSSDEMGSVHDDEAHGHHHHHHNHHDYSHEHEHQHVHDHVHDHAHSVCNHSHGDELNPPMSEQLQHQASLDSLLSSTSSQRADYQKLSPEEKEAFKQTQKAQKDMRKKIVEIQTDKSLSDSEKAKKIQELMTRGWQQKQQTAKSRDTRVINKLENKRSDFELITEEDKLPTYHDKEKKILGCKHYQRAAKLQAHCCGRWDTCRFCHDEVSDHNITRNLITTMMCMYCSHVQPAAQDCENCGEKVAKYYCKDCKLWDSDPRKNIYHCDDCGICRIGKGLGIDYFHCKKCNVCMAISLQGRHKCIERNLESDCPICGEYMFTSTTTVIFMPCGHCIHYKCHQEYIQTSYQCPTCLKSLADMKDYFRRIDEALQQQSMPPEFSSTFNQVYCNDCEVKTFAKFHFMYHKCQKCKGYNTKVLQTMSIDQVPEENLKIIEEDCAHLEELYGKPQEVLEFGEAGDDDEEDEIEEDVGVDDEDEELDDDEAHAHSSRGETSAGQDSAHLAPPSQQQQQPPQLYSLRNSRTTMSLEELNEDIERARRRSLVNASRDESRRGSIVNRGQDQWWCHQCEAATIPQINEQSQVQTCNFCGSDFLEQI